MSNSSIGKVNKNESKIIIERGSFVNKQTNVDQNAKIIETAKGMKRQNAVLEKIKEFKVIEGLIL